MVSKKVLSYLYLPNLFGTQRTKEILNVNPTVIPQRAEAAEVKTFVYDYTPETINEYDLTGVESCFNFKKTDTISWINIDGLRKSDVESVATQFEIHPLLVEDILSINQRPKMDEVEVPRHPIDGAVHAHWRDDRAAF